MANNTLLISFSHLFLYCNFFTSKDFYATNFIVREKWERFKTTAHFPVLYDERSGMQPAILGNSSFEAAP